MGDAERGDASEGARGRTGTDRSDAERGAGNQQTSRAARFWSSTRDALARVRHAMPSPPRDGSQAGFLLVAAAAFGALFTALVTMGLIAAVVGSVALWLKVASLDAAATSAANAIPLEDRFSGGLQVLAVPAAASAAAVLVLLVACRRGSQAQQRNAGGLVPWGLIPVLVALVVVTLGVAVASEAADVAVVGMVLAAALASYGVYELVRMADGLVAGLCVIAIAIATLGTCFQLLYEAIHPAALDMAAVVREDGTALGGFVIGRSSEEVALLVAEPGSPRGRTGVTTLPARHCKSPSVRSNPCYTNTIAVIPGTEVRGFYAGPRDVRVTRANYIAAREFATRASAGALEPRP
jgi:hypothetical protein